MLIIPALREADVISRTLLHFAKQAQVDQRFHVIVSTTRRESQEQIDALQIVRTELEKNRRGNRFANAIKVCLRPDEARIVLAETSKSNPNVLEYVEQHLRRDTATVVRDLLGELNRDRRDAFSLVEAPADATGKVGQLNAALDYVRRYLNLHDGYAA